MAVAYHIEAEAEIVVVRAAGSYAQGSMEPLIDVIAAGTGRLQFPRVLLDIAGISGTIPHLDHYELGVRAAQRLRHVARLAVTVGFDRQVDRLFEDTAHNRGLAVRVFGDAGEARIWLTSP